MMKYDLKNDPIGFRNQSCLKRNTTAAFSLLSVLLALVAIPAAFGADFWEKKDYTEWKQKECIKIMQDSPWAKNYTLTRTSMFDDTRDDFATENPFVQYILQLRSALPIRMAQVRLSQIANNYDDLSDEDKQKFDKGAAEFLYTQPDMVIISVQYGTNMTTEDQALARYWQTQTMELLKNKTFLYGSDDVKIPLLQYITGQGAQREFQFIFPRQYEGKPIITPDTKNLKLEFEIPNISRTGGGRTLLEFKVKDMTVAGEIHY